MVIYHIGKDCFGPLKMTHCTNLRASPKQKMLVPPEEGNQNSYAKKCGSRKYMYCVPGSGHRK